MIDPALFEQLKSKIETDTNIKKELDQILDDLNQHISFTQGVFSRIHSTPRSKCGCTPVQCYSVHLPWLTTSLSLGRCRVAQPSGGGHQERD
jgi:hypothetical protein